MNQELIDRSGGKCELCQKEGSLIVYKVKPDTFVNNEVAICESMALQIDGQEQLVAEDWHFLTDSMWSEIPAIQVLSWRMLNRLKNESWASELLEILYLDDETLEWAKSWDAPDEKFSEETIHKDAFGNILHNGDSVVLTKTLDVKGSSISAKLGSVIRNIRLVEDNPEQIEGRVEGQQIVILTKFLRKQN